MNEFQEVIFVAEWKRLVTAKARNAMLREVYHILEPSVYYHNGMTAGIVRGSSIADARRCVQFIDNAITEFPANDFPLYATAAVSQLIEELKC